MVGGRSAGVHASEKAYGEGVRGREAAAKETTSVSWTELGDGAKAKGTCQ